MFVSCLFLTFLFPESSLFLLAVERALTRPVVFEGDAFDEKALARHNLAHSALSTWFVDWACFHILLLRTLSDTSLLSFHSFDSRDGFVVDDILDKKFVDSGPVMIY